jgi:hypothetical protein
MSAGLPPSVQAMLADDHAPTAPLMEFVTAYATDDNLWWHTACGHHQNLFDAAMDQMVEMHKNETTMLEDLRLILTALGLDSEGARSYSAHEVVQREVLPAIAAMRESLQRYRGTPKS